MNHRALKTYSHLMGAGRMPTDYEVCTTELLYYPARGFEVQVPLSEWYAQYQTGSRLRGTTWERFQDPRETTYARYTAEQRAKEAHLDGLFRSIDASGYDRALNPEALSRLDLTVAPLRFAVHGLQMLAAYVGQMAPSGRITVACAFQAADEMRRVQRIAYRVAQLRAVSPAIAEKSRDAWQNGAPLQPLRRLVERLLVAYDWGEAFAGLCLCTKPLLDDFLMLEMPRIFRAQGDYLWGEICFSLYEDCSWHRQWAAALTRQALEAHPDNRALLSRWISAWMPEAAAAALALADAVGSEARAAAERCSAQATHAAEQLGVLG